MRYSSHPNRTYCETLEEMRNCLKTLNIAPLAGLIEECQIYGNRMEASLWDQRDMESAEKHYKALKKKIKKLEEEYEELEED